MSKLVKGFRMIRDILCNVLRITGSKYRIKRYHKCFKGERCFIVGNGPSLKIEDLERIKGEKSFGTHRIYQIFDMTSWRPSFYCAQDISLINESYDEIRKISQKIPTFIGILLGSNYQKIKNAIFAKLIAKPFYPELPEFSTDASSWIIEGGTVTYMCLQLAIYMGFTEIYLIGVDHQYSVSLTPDGKVEYHENVKDHFSNDDKLTNIPVLYKSTLAYKAFDRYAKSNGIKVINVTRGGKLEVFKRGTLEEIVHD